MTCVALALRIQTITVSASLRPLLKQLPNTKQWPQPRREETCVGMTSKESTRFPTSWARCTPRHTTLRSRLMFSAAGYTSRILVYVLSTVAFLASLKRSSMTTQTRFQWVRASTPPRSSMTLLVPSVVFAKMSPCRRMRPLPESEELET